MILRAGLQRGDVERDGAAQVVGSGDLLRIAFDDDAECGLLIDAVDLEGDAGMTAHGVDLRAVPGADDKSGMLDGEVDREDLRGVIDDDRQSADCGRPQVLPAVLGVEGPG